jgi:hypothetical protein
MTSEPEQFEGEIHSFIGTLAHPEDYEPQFHVNCEKRLPWLNITDMTLHYDTFPDG